MATYCWRCAVCGDAWETTSRSTDHEHALGIRRDYRAENVAIGPAVGAIRRDFKAAADRDLFLPTRKDFEKPNDPDGSRGVKEWNNRHENATKGSGKFRPR